MEDKYRTFNDWCICNGVLAPKLEYPAKFGHDGQLVGVKCTSPIKYREAFMFIPYKLLMTMDKALNTPDLKTIFEKEYIFWKG